MQGIYNIVPTPFDESGAVDEASLRRLIEFVIATGVDGLTILGFLGEAGKLTESERALVIEISVATASGRVPVVVGATAPAMDPGIAFARDAVARGAAGLLVAPPRLARPNEAAVHRHYEALADAVDVPIVVQDFPAGSGVFMTADFIGRLAADIPSCRYLKLEDDPTAQKVSAILAANPDVQVFGGLGGNFMLEELQRGAVGMMTGFGFPEILVSTTATSVPERWTGHATRSIAIYRSSATRTRPDSTCRCASSSTSSVAPSSTPRHAGRTRRSTRRRCSSWPRSSSTWA